MNKSKKTRLMLARLLKLYSEVITDEQVTLISEGELTVGAEVFVTNEDGDLTPAADGEYHAEGVTYVVEAGVITSVEKKEEEVVVEEETTTEEPVEMEDTVEEEETIATIEEVVEEAVAVVEEAPAETEEDKDAKIAELESKIAELEAIIAEYKQREETPVDESVEEEDMKSVKMSKDDSMDSATRLVQYLRNRNK